VHEQAGAEDHRDGHQQPHAGAVPLVGHEQHHLLAEEALQYPEHPQREVDGGDHRQEGEQAGGEDAAEAPQAVTGLSHAPI
jgi:hypothetical protein